MADDDERPTPPRRPSWATLVETSERGSGDGGGPRAPRAVTLPEPEPLVLSPEAHIPTQVVRRRIEPSAAPPIRVDAQVQAPPAAAASPGAPAARPTPPIPPVRTGGVRPEPLPVRDPSGMDGSPAAGRPGPSHPTPSSTASEDLPLVRAVADEELTLTRIDRRLGVILGGCLLGLVVCAARLLSP